MTSMTLHNIANEILELRIRETCRDVMNRIIKKVELTEHRRTKRTISFLRREVRRPVLFIRPFLLKTKKYLHTHTHSYEKNNKIQRSQPYESLRQRTRPRLKPS